MIPTDIGYLPDRQELVGHYACDEQPLETVEHARAYKSALEWFANLSSGRVEDIQAFTKQHGLLRWNWTHEGHGGGSFDSFYLPVEAFREAQKQFQEQWALASSGKRGKVSAVTKWLDDQLAAESKITQVDKQADMWRTSQPKMALQVGHGPDGLAGIEVRLVLGDLWQALCCGLLEKLAEQQGSIRVCKNDLCDSGNEYFVARDPRQDYCGFTCAKRVADRKWARKDRLRKRRKRKAKGRRT